MPTTRPSSIRTSSTVKPSRISAPASAAASTSSLSRTVRRGQYATGASFVPGAPEIVNGTEIEGVGVNRRAAGRGEAIEQSPPRERGDAERLHHVRGHGVARERRAVDHQHAVALAGQQHRRRRTGAARPTMIASYVLFISALLKRGAEVVSALNGSRSARSTRLGASFVVWSAPPGLPRCRSSRHAQPRKHPYLQNQPDREDSSEHQRGLHGLSTLTLERSVVPSDPGQTTVQANRS